SRPASPTEPPRGTAKTKRFSSTVSRSRSDGGSPMNGRRLIRGITMAAIAAGVLLPRAAVADSTLLNVSYDPTRELYQDFNAAFAAYWKAKTGQGVTINQSHGGSG